MGTETGGKGLKALLTLFLLLTAAAGLLADFPFYYRWRQLTRGNICVIFPDFSREQAGEVLREAELVQRELRDFWKQDFRDQVYIVLQANVDDGQGSAANFPANVITISLVPARAWSMIGNFRDWIRSVLLHEFSHIFQMGLDSSLNRSLRRIFGRFPLFYPYINMPYWLLEGLAVQAESDLERGGRLDNAEFEQILRQMASGGTFLGWKEASGNVLRWPAGSAPYIYGAKFARYLEKRFGRDRLLRFMKELTSSPVTAAAGSFRAAFGSELQDCWQDFRAVYDGVAESFPPGLRIVSRDGGWKYFPCFLEGEQVIFYHDDLGSRSALWRLDIATGRRERIVALPGVNSVLTQQGEILLSALDHVGIQHLFSRVFSVDKRTGMVRSLSRNSRLASPFRFDDKLVAVRLGARGAQLVSLEPELRYLGIRAEMISQGAVSPDGKLLALSLKREREFNGIAVFDREMRETGAISFAGNGLYNPRWQDNGSLLFVVRGEEQNELWRWHRESGLLERADLGAFSPQQFDFDPASGRMLFSYFAPRGLDLALLDLEEVAFVPGEPQVAGPSFAQETAPSVGETPLTAPVTGRYSLLRHLGPPFWFPYLALDSFEAGLGLFTLGQDLLGLADYQFYYWYGTRSERHNFDFSLSLRTFFPEFSLAVASIYQQELRRDLFRADLGLKFPLLKSTRRDLFLDLGLGYERDTRPDFRSAGWHWNWQLTWRNYRRYRFGFSRADGLEARLQLHHPDFSWKRIFWAAELKGYLSLGRPNVLAARLAVAESSSPSKKLVFGGYGSDLLFEEQDLSLQQPLALFRFIPAKQVSVAGGWQLNLEYRWALLRFSGISLFGVGFQGVLLVPFLDLGNGWQERRSFDPGWAAGSELQLVLAAAGYRASIALGLSFGKEELLVKPQLYLRLGAAF